MASRITTGEPWPEIGAQIPKGSVIILTAEDGLADTVRIRADAAGADVSKIFIIEGVKKPGKEEGEFFNIREHLPALENASEKGAVAETKAWLLEALSDGPISSSDINKMATENGISGASLRRAKGKLNIESYKDGYGIEGKWLWRLRDNEIH